MRRIIYLARHGETEWNRAGRWQGHTDIPLSEAGRGQARLLAEALRAHAVGLVGASDLSRARETAAIVAESLGLHGVALIDPALRERGFGCFEGLTRAECEQRFPDEWARYRGDPRTPPPGGEPHAQVVERMRAAVIRAAARGSDPALLVSHGGAIRALVGALTGHVPPPLENGATFRIVVVAEDFAEVERIG